MRGQSRIAAAAPAVAEPVEGDTQTLPRFSTANPIARIACIGCGYWGKKVARNLAELNALHAVADTIPTALAADLQ